MEKVLPPPALLVGSGQAGIPDVQLLAGYGLLGQRVEFCGKTPGLCQILPF